MSTVPLNGASAVKTTPTPIGGSQSTRKGMRVQNLGAGELYVGDQDVTPSTGIKIPAGESVPLDGFAGQLYGVSVAGTLDVRWLALS